MKIESEFLDISYEAQPDCTTMEVQVGPLKKRCPVDHGGMRMVCLSVPASMVGHHVPVKVTGDGRLDTWNIHSRIDEFDVAGLSHNHSAEKECISKADSMPLSVQWFATWKCNYNCSYCWQESVNLSYRSERPIKTSVDKWVDALLRLKPKEVYITGGEPTILGGIENIVAMLGEYTHVSMTSNLGKSFNLDKWFATVPPKAISGVTFSFHPSQVSWEDYQFKLEQFCDHYGPEKTGVELVMHPDQVGFKQPLIDTAKRLGIEVVKIDPYFEQPKLYPKQVGKSVCNQEAFPADPAARRPNNVYNREPYYCPAGMKRINVDPVGDVFTCMSAIDRGKMFGRHTLPHYKSIGNIFDPGFQLRPRPTLCWETFRCSQCDADRLADYWVPHGFQCQLPIPE